MHKITNVAGLNRHLSMFTEDNTEIQVFTLDQMRYSISVRAANVEVSVTVCYEDVETLVEMLKRAK